jgi:hypothetical protein
MTIHNTNIPGLVKDTETNLVLNTNASEYQNYLLQKQRLKRNMSIEEEINNLKKEMQEMKLAFQSILNGNNNG